MESYTYYVKKGDNNRVAELPATSMADGLTTVTIADYEKEYFLQYWDQYYWDANGDLQSPNDLPSHSEAMLRLKVSDQAATLAEYKSKLVDANKTIETLTTNTAPIPQLQQMLIQSSQAQAQSASEQSQIKTMLVQMSQAMAQNQASQVTTN